MDSIVSPLPPSHIPGERLCDIDMYNHILGEEDYHESWVRIQRSHALDLVWTPHNGGHWVALRGSMIKEIYGDYARFSSEVMYIPKVVGEQYDMVPVRMDPPEHTPFRAVLNKGLSLREVRKFDEVVRKIAISLVDAVKDKGECDFCIDFANKFPIYVFLAMAGLPQDDMPMLAVLGNKMTKVTGATPAEMVAGFERARDDFFDYVKPAIEARKGKDGTDIISVLVNSEVDGAPMSEHDTLCMISLVLLAGLDTTANFLGFMFAFLAKNPAHLKQLTDDPAQIPRRVEEMFRRFPVVAEARMVAHDLIYEGVELKKGEMVLLPTTLNGLDERVNQNAMELDFNRTSITHTTFGEGAHRCVGLHLARLEAIVTLQEWLTRIPEFRLAPGARHTYLPGLIAGIANVPLRWTVSRGDLNGKP